jgi:glycosyltransferase involved in cell wall biosynthesis
MSGLHIAMVGTRGVPARYGGFETAIEEIGQRLVLRGHKVTVYCRDMGEGTEKPAQHLGMDLVHLAAMRKRTLETLSHTGLSVAHMLRHRPDAAIVFNAANAPYLPAIRMAGIPVATHVDGLEWQRAKWGRAGRKYYQSVEKLAVIWSDSLIADAVGIQDYYRQKFDADTVYLAYGAPLLEKGHSDKLAQLGLEPQGYHLVVARFEPENNVHLIVEGFARSTAKLPLIVVGSAPYSDRYTQQVHELADARVRFVGGLWDQELLDQLYANAKVYWHGHSVGGTNPSLLRAAGSGTATNAFDVGFNREVLESSGRYFADPQDVARLAAEAELPSSDTLARGEQARQLARRYNWDQVTDGYEQLSRDLARSRARTRAHAPQGAPRQVSQAFSNASQSLGAGQ